MVIDSWDLEHRRIIGEVWDRLPDEVRRGLDHVRFTSGEHARKSWASAGQADVDISRLPWTTPASIGVIVHELGHIAGRHAELLTMGQITKEFAEREADQFARQWGFEKELEARRDLIGR